MDHCIYTDYMRRLRHFDALRQAYELSCPVIAATTHVQLHQFRQVTQLPGPQHPAVFSCLHDCACETGPHTSLMAHDELDWSPTAGLSGEVYMPLSLSPDPAKPTSAILDAGMDLVQTQIDQERRRHLLRGEWPWMFWCRREEAARPAFPSNMRRLIPVQDDEMAVVFACQHCGLDTVNLVSQAHVDIPFHTDRSIKFVDAAVDPVAPWSLLRLSTVVTVGL